MKSVVLFRGISVLELFHRHTLQSKKQNVLRAVGFRTVVLYALYSVTMGEVLIRMSDFFYRCT